MNPLILPEAFRPLATKPFRYKVPWGGRGSAKSWTIAGVLVYLAAKVRVRVLCAREIQASIADSVHKLLSDQVYRLGLVGAYRPITANRISSHTGSEFLFKGLRHNANEIKSTEGIDICWVEEAQLVSDDSWQLLIPTIRKPGSEIWISFNPENETDPTYQRFIVNTPPEAWVQKVSWRDNPWFPVELEKERLYLKRVDPDAYAHVWEGECKSASDAQILKGKWVVEDFTPVLPSSEPGAPKAWDGPYAGADWGFSNDPTTGVLMWVDWSSNTLYIEHEAWGIGVDIDKTPALFDTIPGFKSVAVRGDSARPETISYLQRHGYGNVVPCEKWVGSVEDGVSFLRAFERIVIHSRCKHVAAEARAYRYKVDKTTGEVTRDIVDADNHCIDAIRYGLWPLIRKNKQGALLFIEQETLRASQEHRA